ncbi:MAG: hypothetical protein AAFP04_05305 [Myxococcota bacterium]
MKHENSVLALVVRWALASSLLVVAACGDSEGEVVVTAYGEDFIELGIVADEVGDGWSIDFSSFEVEVEEVEVAGRVFEDLGTVELTVPTDGAGHELSRSAVDAGEFSGPRYVLGGIHVVGVAERQGVSKSFDWRFPARVAYSNCETTTLVEEGDTATFEITVHADHLLYDSLVAEEPSLFFDPIASADGNADDVITETELAEVDIGGYDPGNSGANDMWAYLTALVGNLGHVDGEGHCDAN